MAPIEVLATIFAVAILIKVIILLINPEPFMKIAESMLKNTRMVVAIYFILAVVVGYYILSSLSAIEVAAVMLFTAILIGLTLFAYSNAMFRIIKETPRSRADLFKKTWLSMLIWVGIAIWTLYALIT